MNGLLWRRLKWVLAGSLPFILVYLASSYTPGMAFSRRPMNSYETTMSFFAQNLGEAALCDNISWAAYQSYSVMFGGGGASFQRSDCYERVAEETHDASVCWKVRPLVDFDPLSAGYSALACRRRTRSGYESGIALPNDALIHTFQQLGYDADSLYVEGAVQPAIRTRDVYLGLEHDPAAITRAERLATRPDPRLQTDDAAYLADLAAIGSADPAWCGHIPPEQGSSEQQTPFRDWCYYTVAYDTHDTRICGRMKPAAAEAKVIAAKASGIKPDVAEQMSLHADCDRIRKPAEGTRALHYGPELPPDPVQVQRLVTALDVGMPSSRDWPQGELAAYYLQALFALGERKPPNAARDTARAEFVRRLMALHAPVE
jgi:hypothetical protein